MEKKLTITIDEEVYNGLCRAVGADGIGRYVECLLRSHLPAQDMAEGYRAMAADEVREREALEWSENLAGDVSDDSR